MFGYSQLYYKLLRLPLSIFLKSQSIPEEPLQKLELNTSRPIMYVLPYHSKVALLTLRTQCIVHNLPDPLELLSINGISLPRCVFIDDRSRVVTRDILKEKSIRIFHQYLDLHQNNPKLDVQIVPVSVLLGRRPGRQKKKENASPRILNTIRIFFSVSWLGRDSFVCFSSSVSFRRITDQYGNDKIIAKKLARVARIYFSRQRIAVIGPLLTTRKDLFNKLLVSKTISRAIEDEVRIKKISHKRAKDNAIILMKEISSHFSYEMIRIVDRILRFTWNRLYSGINVYNIEHIRQLAHDGYAIVYIPCHRSHMDYLLISYVLYHQGLAPPYIAAGTNLNFWPIGFIFRCLGAFFIRRTFTGNKLYSIIFREYLCELFRQGYPIEYFIEGSRSRTGRLLDPKKGILSMTIQSILRGDIRPITLVPIYIGYEHIMEVGTYAKELRGASKKKESLLRMLRGICKLRNLGRVCVNFGDPIQLIPWLNQYVPGWYKFINPTETIRPIWLMPIVNDIAIELMVRINNAGVINAMNLCCTALLAAYQFSLTREQLTEQLECYLDIIRNIPYSKNTIMPTLTATQLINHILKMKEFEVKQNSSGDVISFPRKQEVSMTYYRNNIVHILILPSIIATIVIQHQWITHQELLRYFNVLYPMLKSELFLNWRKENLVVILDKLIIELLRQKLLIKKNGEINVNPIRLHTLKLLAASARETLQRYTIAFGLLSFNPSMNREILENKSRILAQRLSILHSISATEFFDKTIFNTFMLVLRDEGYIKNKNNTEFNKTKKVYQMLSTLISSDIRLTIESAMRNERYNHHD